MRLGSTKSPRPRLARREAIIEDSDSDYEEVVQKKSTVTKSIRLVPKSPKSPSNLSFRLIDRSVKRPAPDSTTATPFSKTESNGSVTSSSSSALSKKPKTMASTTTDSPNVKKVGMALESRHRASPKPRDEKYARSKWSETPERLKVGWNGDSPGQMRYKDMSRPPTSSSNKSGAFSVSTVASAKNSPGPSSHRYLQHQRHRPVGFDERGEEEEDYSAILGEFGSLINKRLNARKVMIEKAFQIVKTPNILFETQKENAKSRMDKYRRYVSAMNQFKTHTDSIMKTHDGHKELLHRMVDSLSKGWRVMTQDTVKIQDELKSCLQRIVEARESTAKSIEKIVLDSVDQFRESLANWEQDCLDAVDEDAVKCLESITKFI